MSTDEPIVNRVYNQEHPVNWSCPTGMAGYGLLRHIHGCHRKNLSQKQLYFKWPRKWVHKSILSKVLPAILGDYSHWHFHSLKFADILSECDIISFVTLIKREEGGSHPLQLIGISCQWL